MNKLFFAGVFLLAIQASDCATAGSVQDSTVTQAKREVDAPVATPTPVRMRDVYPVSYPAAEYAPEPKLPKRPGVK